MQKPGRNLRGADRQSVKVDQLVGSQPGIRRISVADRQVHARATCADALACTACGELRPERVTRRVAPFAEAGDAMTNPGPWIVFTR